jgi:hypothetical protein
MTTAYSTNLELALPVQGELSGTWGDTVNNGITQYLDTAIAGSQIISGSQTAVTLTNTNGTNLATNIAQVGSGSTGTAQYQVIRCTGNPAGLLTITVSDTPTAGYSKTFVIINATSTSQSVKIVGSGPTTGVTVVSGAKSLVAWNGSDFVEVASSTADGVTTFSAGTTGLTPSTATSGAVTLAGVLAAANGGTGQSSYAVGDILYASGSTALSKLPDVATGNALISGGVGVAPAYGKIGLTTHVSGTLPVANGGTNITSYTTGDIVYASASGTLASLADVATGNALISGGVGVAPSYGKIGLTTHVSGTLPVGNGGTGITTTPTNGQIPIGNGTNYVAAAITAGSGISVTNGSGSITIASTASVAAATPTALGTVYAKTNDVSSYQTFLGYQAGDVNTGTYNAFVGYQTGRANTSGARNVALGAFALDSNITGDNSVAIGYSALSGVTANSGSIAIGYNAGYQYTGANKFIAIGDSAFSNTGGMVESVGIGTSVGTSMTSGQWNTFVGDAAASSRTAGTDNTAIGRASLTAGSGDSNTAVGASAMGRGNVTTAANHVAVGYQASWSVVSANANTAVGMYALRLATTGGDNVALGYTSNWNLTTGAGNVSLGNSTLASNTVNSSNTAIGTGALYSVEADNNTALGRNAGFYVSTGANNTLLGRDAGNDGVTNLTTGANNTIIGYNAASSSASVSNEITLGNASVTAFRVPGLSISWAATDVPFRNIPQNAQTGSYTLVLADSGKHIYHASGAGAATYTIPANGSVAYPIGTAVTFINLSSTSISIAITTDTMYLAKDGTTGTRTLAQYGSATAIKVDTTIWMISGSALT